ncbi:hypothetical protein J6590_062536 [Homalodisca vitripennis]|nr:hypothetical protein J6590_062536 [Homalodisca vitripennis]
MELVLLILTCLHYLLVRTLEIKMEVREGIFIGKNLKNETFRSQGRELYNLGKSTKSLSSLSRVLLEGNEADRPVGFCNLKPRHNTGVYQVLRFLKRQDPVDYVVGLQPALGFHRQQSRRPWMDR